ncbi:MAG TPA: DNA polymerase IV, partial [Pseudomonadales bacterium]|nr:DNA polymerase IV [Pseudomonadales bacterium]
MSQINESTRKIIHIDMDAYFAAIEQRDHPQWRGKPLIVGGAPNSRGVVA